MQADVGIIAYNNIFDSIFLKFKFPFWNFSNWQIRMMMFWAFWKILFNWFQKCQKFQKCHKFETDLCCEFNQFQSFFLIFAFIDSICYFLRNFFFWFCIKTAWKNGMIYRFGINLNEKLQIRRNMTKFDLTSSSINLSTAMTMRVLRAVIDDLSSNETKIDSIIIL